MILVASLVLASAVGAVSLDSGLERVLREAAPSVLARYRVPHVSDLVFGWKSHRTCWRAKADFNGDGLDDTAALLVAKAGRGFELVVVLGAHKRPKDVLVLEEGPGVAQGFGVAVARPGRYRTAAGKGYDTGDGDPPEITLGLPAIDRYHFESWNGYWYWDSGAKRFKYIAMSD